jgi:formate dehydrogenase subunit delta
MTNQTHSNIATLIRSANEIASFFQSYPEQSAIVSIADHINSFWTPTMREDFIACSQVHKSEFHPLVQHAVALIKPRRS